MFNRLTTRLILSHLLVITVAMALLSFVLLSLVQGYSCKRRSKASRSRRVFTAQALTSSQGITLTNIMQTILPSASNVLQQQQFNRLRSRPFPNVRAGCLVNTSLATRIRVTTSAESCWQIATGPT